MRRSVVVSALVVGVLLAVGTSAGLVARMAALAIRGEQVAQLTGRVETKARPNSSPATAVVYAEPVGGTAAVRPVKASMSQKNKAFAPRVLGVPVGSSVAFPNNDPIFHNVFSLSAPQPFDLGLYRSGASTTRTFTEPAAYHVFCNIHPQMVAFIVVAPTPFITSAAPDGAWKLDVPPGRYRVTVLSERAAPVSVDARTDVATPIVLTLDESAAVQTAHLNKFGKPYPPESYQAK